MRQARPQVEHLLQGRDLEPPVVERVVLAYLRQPLDRTQRLQFGQREVFGEPAGDRGAVDDLRGPAGRELRSGRDVCGTGDLRLVPRDEYVIAGGYEVGLDEEIGRASCRERVTM